MMMQPIETVEGGDFRRWALGSRARQLRGLMVERLAARMGWPAVAQAGATAWAPVIGPLVAALNDEHAPGDEVMGALSKAFRATRIGAASNEMTRLMARQIAGAVPNRAPAPLLPAQGWLGLGMMAWDAPDFSFWLRHRLLEDIYANSVAVPGDAAMPPIWGPELWPVAMVEAALNGEGIVGQAWPAIAKALGQGALGFWPQYLCAEMLLRNGKTLSSLPAPLAAEMRDWYVVNMSRYADKLAPKMIGDSGALGIRTGRRLTRDNIPDWALWMIPIEARQTQDTQTEEDRVAEQATTPMAAPMPAPDAQPDIPSDHHPEEQPVAPPQRPRQGWSDRRAAPVVKGWGGQGLPPSSFDDDDDDTDKGSKG